MKTILQRLQSPRLKLTSDSLLTALLNAIDLLETDGEYEEGGFILKKGDDYKFVKINSIVPPTHAASLYIASPKEYGEKIIMAMDDGWFPDSSFHTHPNGYGSYPSITDFENLFLGFGRNYIYSPAKEELAFYQYKDSKRSPHISKETDINIKQQYYTSLWQRNLINL